MKAALEELIENIKKADYYAGHEDLETYWHTIRKTDEPLKNLIKGFINGVTAFELVRMGRMDAAHRVWRAHEKWRGRLLKEGIAHYDLFIKADRMLQKLHDEQLS
jgi:predicted metal-dependent hydrolase